MQVQDSVKILDPASDWHFTPKIADLTTIYMANIWPSCSQVDGHALDHDLHVPGVSIL